MSQAGQFEARASDSDTESTSEALPAIERRRLAAHFHRDIVECHRTLKREIGYNANRFLQMVNESDVGGEGAARALLHGPDTHDGFTRLYLADRLQQSVEALVLRPEYEPLFTEQERRRGWLGRELARWQRLAVGLGACVPPVSRSGVPPRWPWSACSVSSSRPSNRACGSPAHGSPTFFTGGVRLDPPGPVGSGCDDDAVEGDQAELVG
jgi:hypothetical protein